MAVTPPAANPQILDNNPKKTARSISHCFKLLLILRLIVRLELISKTRLPGGCRREINLRGQQALDGADVAVVYAIVKRINVPHETGQDFRAEIDRFFPEAGEKIHDRRGHYVYGAIGQISWRVFHFFMKRPDDTAFVEFDDPAFFGLDSIESHHRYFDALLPFLVPPDEGSDVEVGQVVRMNEHRRLTPEEIPVFKERPARSQQGL